VTTYNQLREAHPCFGERKANRGRIHLPVSPGCNIECKFCERKLDREESCPGVAVTVIRPDEALDIVRRAVDACPEISVVGIAGPGDTLVTPYALDTLRRVGA